MSRWLDRALLVGPYFCLCLTEQSFRKELKAMGITDRTEFLATEQADATAHVMHKNGDLAVIVCIGNTAGKTGAQIAAMLVHEAVHIWQKFREHIGERNPGDETEAYAIQSISQRLMESYVRQTSV